MKTLWNVLLPWALNGDPDEEGTYATTVAGETEGEALRAAAVEMADEGSKKFDTPQERAQFIESRVTGWCDVYETKDQLQQDLSALYARELFPDGIRHTINLNVLGRLLAENRDSLLVRG